MVSCCSSSGGFKRDGKGGLLLLPSTRLLPLALCRTWGTDPLTSEPLSNYSKSGTDLLFGAPDSDVALPKRGAASLLDGEGGYSSAGYVSDLFKAASLSSNDMTCAGVRNDTGHGEPLRGRHSRREVLCEGECKGGGVRCHRRDALGGGSLALALRTLGIRCWGHRGGCDAGAGLPLEGRDPRQEAADLTTKSGDRCGEGLEISSGGGGHRMYSYERGRHEYTTIAKRQW